MASGSRLDYKILAQPYTVDKDEFIDVLHPVHTTSQLEDADHRINAKDKFIGKQAFNSNRGEPVFASGPLAADAWYPAAPALVTEAGAGITDGSGTIYKSSVSRAGGIITTQIFLDLTGLSSATTVLDIIGIGSNPAHLGQITTARNGTILSGKITCLELPASLTDIDLYSAVEATGVFESLVTALTQTALFASGGAWAKGDEDHLTLLPAPNSYLYLVNGAADTADPFTAGRFMIELIGV